jgi:hypothetical protein
LVLDGACAVGDNNRDRVSPVGWERGRVSVSRPSSDGKIAAISVARKLARRCYHVLRNVDPELVYATPG